MWLWRARIGRGPYWVGVATALAILYGAPALSGHNVPSATGLIVWMMLYTWRLHDIGRSLWWAVGALASSGIPIALGLVFGGPGFLAVLGHHYEDVTDQGALWFDVVAVTSVLIQHGFTLWLGLQKGDSGENRFGPAPVGWNISKPGPPPPRRAGDDKRVGGPQRPARVVASGWTRQEAEMLLADFAGKYALPPADLRLEAEASSGSPTITFPEGIEPRLLYFLVNYLQYAQTPTSEGRAVAVVGHVPMSWTLGVELPRLQGRPTTLYVPAADTAHDCVYARVDGGQAYAIDLGNLRWRPVDDPRTPEAIGGL